MNQISRLLLVQNKAGLKWYRQRYLFFSILSGTNTFHQEGRFWRTYIGVSLSSSVSFPPDFLLFFRSNCNLAAHERLRPLSLAPKPSAPTGTAKEARRGGSGGGSSQSLSCLYRSANVASDARRPLEPDRDGGGVSETTPSAPSAPSAKASSSSVSAANGSPLYRRGDSSADSCRLASCRLGRCVRRPRGVRPARFCSRDSASGTGDSVKVGSTLIFNSTRTR